MLIAFYVHVHLHTIHVDLFTHIFSKLLTGRGDPVLKWLSELSYLTVFEWYNNVHVQKAKCTCIIHYSEGFYNRHFLITEIVCCFIRKVVEQYSELLL